MITSYKRTEYLEQAIRSVLSQNIGEQEMQIEVVDDCSPLESGQKIAQIVQEVGKGRVTFYHQPQNVGIYNNWNTCINRARGRWIHILSDDDLVMPNFYQAYRQQIEANQCSMVIGQSVSINQQEQWLGISKSLQAYEGLLDNALKKLSRDNPIRTPAIIVAREAYEQVGGFTDSLVYAPDWEMWTRLAANFNVAYVKRPYSQFRCHTGSETNKLVLTATSVADSLAASQIIQLRFDNFQDRQEIKLSVNKWLSNESRYLSNKFASEGYYYSAWIHALWVLRLTPSISSLKNIINVFLKMLKSLLIKLFHSLKFQY
ncbi:glycosyltransferase family 2 protein [Stanieria cyanosphaera]|nr:glycosyltransferase [Stanieria cyanosphaera]